MKDLDFSMECLERNSVVKVSRIQNAVCLDVSDIFSVLIGRLGGSLHYLNLVTDTPYLIPGDNYPTPLLSLLLL